MSLAPVSSWGSFLAQNSAYSVLQEAIKMPHTPMTANAVLMVISVPRAAVSRGRALAELTAAELGNMHKMNAPFAPLDPSVAWALKHPRTAREGRMVTALA